MSYEIIDMKKWERRNEFFVFTKLTPGYFSFTVDIDITNTYKKLKEQGLKLFPATLYIMGKVINTIPEFRFGYEKHELVRYDKLNPMFPYFHESSCSCSVFWLPVKENFREFHQDYRDYIEKYGKVTSYMGPLDKPTPKNVFTLSMEHRIHFKTASIIPIGTSEEPMFSPTLLCGKFAEENGRLMMPVSITIHHAVSDGYHISRFYNQVQKMFSVPEEWTDC